MPGFNEANGFLKLYLLFPRANLREICLARRKEIISTKGISSWDFLSLLGETSIIFLKYVFRARVVKDVDAKKCAL